jgi:hypothetical protein
MMPRRASCSPPTHQRERNPTSSLMPFGAFRSENRQALCDVCALLGFGRTYPYSECPTFGFCSGRGAFNADERCLVPARFFRLPAAVN